MCLAWDLTDSPVNACQTSRPRPKLHSDSRLRIQTQHYTVEKLRAEFAYRSSSYSRDAKRGSQLATVLPRNNCYLQRRFQTACCLHWAAVSHLWGAAPRKPYGVHRLNSWEPTCPTCPEIIEKIYEICQKSFISSKGHTLPNFASIIEIRVPNLLQLF